MFISETWGNDIKNRIFLSYPEVLEIILQRLLMPWLLLPLYDVGVVSN